MRPAVMENARSAASGLANTYVELRNTAGRAEPNDRLGSKPRVSTAVRGRNSPWESSRCDIIAPFPSVRLMPDKYRYEEFTWPEIREAVAQNRVAVLPVGTVEQHGPHLPLVTDVLT